MNNPFDRDHLLVALDAVGIAAASNGTRLHLAIYGGSALMLAGNFRFSTEDVDIAEIDVRPAWLDAVVAEIAAQNGWSANWLDALAGGIAEYLYKRWAPFRPPPWIKDRARYLDRPWWPIGEGDPALMEYLTWASPPEFASRNIMTDEAPLRRATQPPVEPLTPFLGSSRAPSPR